MQHDEREREGGRREKSKKVEGEEEETVVGKRRKEEKTKRERDRREKVGTQEGEEGERDLEGRKEDEVRRESDEEGDKQVKKDVTDWVEVRRRTRRKRCKMAQIFVKVNGSKAIPIEVNLTDDTVEDVMKRIQSDEDAYVTMQGKVLKISEKLKSCGVTDGCTIQVTSRMRGGGKHKDKKSKGEKKQVAQLDDGMCAMACEQ